MSANFTLDTTKMDEIIRDLPARIDEWLDAVADRIVDEVQESFGVSPSTPGDPPGIVCGELKDSVEAVKDPQGGYQVIVGAEHGLYQEFGTETIAPRPFMTPIFHTWERKFATDAVDYGLIT